MTDKEKREKMSVLDELKKLDDQRAKLIEGAKAEALKKAEAAIAELNALGFPYSLVAGDSKGSKKSGITRKRADDAPCSVCNFVTIPQHDARKHRSQGDNKKPFTAKELESFGLKKA